MKHNLRCENRLDCMDDGFWVRCVSQVMILRIDEGLTNGRSLRSVLRSRNARAELHALHELGVPERATAALVLVACYTTDAERAEM
jgi:hypothetical protein